MAWLPFSVEEAGTVRETLGTRESGTADQRSSGEQGNGLDTLMVRSQALELYPMQMGWGSVDEAGMPKPLAGRKKVTQQLAAVLDKSKARVENAAMISATLRALLMLCELVACLSLDPLQKMNHHAHTPTPHQLDA